MRNRETPIHSFTIRLWLEERQTKEVTHPNNARWRGHITHIPTRFRRYFEDLDDIKPFISSYLSEPDEDDPSSFIPLPS